MISVITATYNSRDGLPRLAESLVAQTYRGFEWIVVDGGSTDGTVEFLSQFAERHSWCRYTSATDFGIYDALNRGIGQSGCEYYAVAGSDDWFSEEALSQYAAVMQAQPLADIVLANVRIGCRIKGGFHPDRAWLGHQRVFGGSHSIGMLIRNALHEQLGSYSNRFPMLADGYFLKVALNSKAVKFVVADFVAGEFALGGLSSSGKLQSLAESWQIQMLTERRKGLQVAVFLTKVLLRLPALLRSGR